jgi:phage-related protein
LVQHSFSVGNVLDLLAEFLLDHIGVLHGFIKKTQKTPDEELTLARRRKREFET